MYLQSRVGWGACPITADAPMMTNAPTRELDHSRTLSGCSTKRSRYSPVSSRSVRSRA